jgi:hypothetical protein
VRVYRLTGRNWVQVGSDIDGEAAGDKSGWGVSFSSDGFRVAIGAISNADGDLYGGHVRVYDLTGRGITSEPRSLEVTMKRTVSKTLAWQVPASLNGGSITDYIIQYRVARTALWSTFADGISTSRRATVTGLTKTVKYQFRVAARTAEGDSPYSTASKAS